MSTSEGAKNKKFIFTADDFGMQEAFDMAVLKASTEGFLTCACVCANGESFDYALDEVFTKCPTLELGVHLNIIEGKSLTKCPTLVNREGNFNNSFGALILKALTSKKFLHEVEMEFRAQIERVIAKVGVENIGFLNSHVHTHAICPIFELVCRLAREYGILHMRLQAEKFYRTEHMPKPINIIKLLLLNYFSVSNRMTARKYGIITNDFLIGVGFTGEMSPDALLCGAKSLRNFQNISLEALIHPSNDHGSVRYSEFQTSLDLETKVAIEKMGFEFTNFKNLN